MLMKMYAFKILVIFFVCHVDVYVDNIQRRELVKFVTGSCYIRVIIRKIRSSTQTDNVRVCP